MEEKQLEALVKDMSLKEKVHQLVQLTFPFLMKDTRDEIVTGPLAQLGVTEETAQLTGSTFGSFGAKITMELQRKYMESHPHGIPLLIMLDVIHGLRTVFPVPLGQGASFEPELSKRCAAVAAKEAAVSGIHVTFAPMADLVRDARWGRVVESTGEDPWLNGLFAKAMVKGFQGNNVREPYKVAACIKHFAAYGAAVAGRDYNTAEITEHTLKEAYLPAYREGIRAGAEMVMTSFNTVNGIPASVNRWLMREILRGEMGFKGVLVSDYGAVGETVAHGCSENAADAAKRALEAGVDLDMMSNSYFNHLENLVEEGLVEEKLIDESVLRVLRLKNKLGLFENPYKDADEEKEKEIILCDEHRQLSREAAVKSFVLLKNEGLLPLGKNQKLAFIGPYVFEQHLMGSWAVAGRPSDVVSVAQAAGEILSADRTSYCQGCGILENDDLFKKFHKDAASLSLTEEENDRLLLEALEAAREADTVIMPLGEFYLQSGEATSRAFIEVPERQIRLLEEVSRVNPDIVVVLFNGRPLDIRKISSIAKSVLEVWMPGTEGGHAVMDVLTGKSSPSGKLPMSFPYCAGQVPVYYNEYMTGRPHMKEPGEDIRYRSKYLDIPNEPLYPFGYGLTYTEFSVSDVKLSAEEMRKDEEITASVVVKNIGKETGTEVVQMYIRDVAASIVRPVKELKGFEKVTLYPGEEREILFTISENELEFVLPDGNWGSEPGDFKVYIGTDSTTENCRKFRLV